MSLHSANMAADTKVKILESPVKCAKDITTPPAINLETSTLLVGRGVSGRGFRYNVAPAPSLR